MDNITNPIKRSKIFQDIAFLNSGVKNLEKYPRLKKKVNDAVTASNIKQTINIYCLLRPCFKTNAFCAPIANISDNPKKKAEKKVVK